MFTARIGERDCACLAAAELANSVAAAAASVSELKWPGGRELGGFAASVVVVVVAVAVAAVALAG